MELTPHQIRREKEKQDFIKSLKTEPPVECDFKVGDVVTFTNEYGVSFPNIKVVGFAEDDSFYGRFIYLDSDSWWFPSRPEECSKEEDS